MEQSLLPFRVLDLTDEKGYLCGKILGDLGADVLKIEKPGGDFGRNIGPYYANEPHPEKSLFWYAFNNNKRGLTLNIESKDGQAIFKKLSKNADFVIESFAPGFMDSLGLGYSELSTINPRIIMASITPFGQAGPYSNYIASDIVCMAMSGPMYSTGEPDRPPVRIGFPQAYLNGGLEAAVGCMIAHYYREATNEGQHVDVSIQESIYLTAPTFPIMWEFNQYIFQRTGEYRPLMGSTAIQRVVWQCQDGHVAFVLFGGVSGATTNKLLTEWMDVEGYADECIKNIDWTAFDMITVTQDVFNKLEESIGKFFLAHTKQELYEGALKRSLMLYPVCTPKDILENAQLSARNFWIDVDHNELGKKIRYPSALIKMSNFDYSIKRRAPLIGEHNIEIYCQELGLASSELISLKEANII